MEKERIDLAYALREDPLCLGVAWRIRGESDLWDWQNDNDLGLDLDGCDEAGPIEAEKLVVSEEGHYVILDEGGEWPEEKEGVPLTEAIACLKRCHPYLFPSLCASRA